MFNFYFLTDVSGGYIEETVFGRCPEADLQLGHVEHNCPEAKACEVRHVAKGSGFPKTPNSAESRGRVMSKCESEIIKVRLIKVEGLKRTAFPNRKFADYALARGLFRRQILTGSAEHPLAPHPRAAIGAAI